jgi:hypothetical protein
MDHKKHMRGSTLGDRRYQPLEARLIVGVKENKVGLRMPQHQIGSVALAIGIDPSAIAMKSRQKNRVKGLGSSFAGNIMITFGKDEGQTQVRLLDEGNRFHVLPPGQRLIPA